MLEDDEMIEVEVLVGCESIAAFEEEGGVFVPRAASVDKTWAAAAMGKREPLEVAFGDGGIMPEEVLVSVGAHAATRSGFVKAMKRLVLRILPEAVDQDSPRGQGLVPIAAERATTSIAHRNAP